jgi:HK97 gp10 family phage protein
MARSGIQITGFKELQRRAQKVDVKLRKKIYAKAARAAGKAVVEAAKSSVPVRTGGVRRSLVHRSASKPSKGLFGVKVTVKGGKLGASSGRSATRRRGKGGTYNPDAIERYYRFTELGTKYHPAQPYLKPSLEMHTGKIIEVFRSTIAAGIEEALR